MSRSYSCVPRGINLSRYSAPTMARRNERRLRLSVETKSATAGTLPAVPRTPRRRPRTARAPRGRRLRPRVRSRGGLHPDALRPAHGERGELLLIECHEAPGAERRPPGRPHIAHLAAGGPE